jgi:hypothetical protein
LIDEGGTETAGCVDALVDTEDPLDPAGPVEDDRDVGGDSDWSPHAAVTALMSRASATYRWRTARRRPRGQRADAVRGIRFRMAGTVLPSISSGRVGRSVDGERRSSCSCYGSAGPWGERCSNVGRSDRSASISTLRVPDRRPKAVFKPVPTPVGTVLVPSAGRPGPWATTAGRPGVSRPVRKLDR